LLLFDFQIKYEDQDGARSDNCQNNRPVSPGRRLLAAGLFTAEAWLFDRHVRLWRRKKLLEEDHHISPALLWRRGSLGHQLRSHVA